MFLFGFLVFYGMPNFVLPLFERVGVIEYADCTSAEEWVPLQATSLQGITLNSNGWWGSSPGDLCNVVYYSLSLLPGPFSTGVVVSVYGASMDQIGFDLVRFYGI